MLQTQDLCKIITSLIRILLVKVTAVNPQDNTYKNLPPLILKIMQKVMMIYQDNTQQVISVRFNDVKICMLFAFCRSATLR